MAPPVKPVAPAQPLRSQPSTFSARAEAAIAYQFGDLPNWMESLGVYITQQRESAEAAAAAAGAADGLNLAGKNLQIFRVNAGASSTEFVPIETAINPYLTTSGRGAVTGDIKIQAGITAPAGWLKCNGAAVSRTTYAPLFGTIGTNYGVGNGSTTFNLPDLRGEFVRGWDDGRGVDGGRVIGSAQAQGIQNHGHAAGALLATIGANGAHGHTVANNVLQFGVVTDGALLSSAGANIGVNDQGTSTAPNHTHPATITGSTATTGGPETRPRNIACLFCIKI